MGNTTQIAQAREVSDGAATQTSQHLHEVKMLEIRILKKCLVHVSASLKVVRMLG